MANEKRLIDADTLVSMLEDMKERHRKSLFFVSANAYEGARRIVNALETVDAVEVVRCKDCKRWSVEYRFCKAHGLDEYGGSPFGENGFCSYGERKDDGV